jgi:glycine dehydrogenase subunit 1
LVTAATIYMSLLGAAGLQRVAAASLQRTADLVARLCAIAGVKAAFTAARFHEAVAVAGSAGGAGAWRSGEPRHLGGLDLTERYPELGHALLVCATETKLDVDIDSYAAALAEVMQVSRAAA